MDDAVHAVRHYKGQESRERTVSEISASRQNFDRVA